MNQTCDNPTRIKALVELSSSISNGRTSDLLRSIPTRAYLKRHREYNRRWIKNNPIKSKISHTKGSRKFQLKKYGMTGLDYEQLLKMQNGLCCICEKPETRKQFGKIQLLAVDHCHKAGNVRGLLCNRCNIVIGLLDDDIDLLSKIESYLRKDKNG